jgi:hypothetical protein
MPLTPEAQNLLGHSYHARNFAAGMQQPGPYGGGGGYGGGGLNPMGMGGEVASYMAAYRRRKQQVGLAGGVTTRPPALGSDNEGMAGGAMPNVTASPNFGGFADRTRKMAESVNLGGPQFKQPVTMQFAQKPEGPQFQNAMGQPMLNDPETLDKRVADARAKLGMPDQLLAGFKLPPFMPPGAEFAPPGASMPDGTVSTFVPPAPAGGRAAGGMAAGGGAPVIDPLLGTALPAGVTLRQPPSEFQAEQARRQGEVKALGFQRGRDRKDRIAARNRVPSMMERYAMVNPEFGLKMAGLMGENQHRGAMLEAMKAELGLKKDAGEGARKADAERLDLARAELGAKIDDMGAGRKAEGDRMAMLLEQFKADQQSKMEMAKGHNETQLGAAKIAAGGRGEGKYAEIAAQYDKAAQEAKAGGDTQGFERYSKMADHYHNQETGNSSNVSGGLPTFQTSMTNQGSGNGMTAQAAQQNMKALGLDYNAVRDVGSSYGTLSPEELYVPGQQKRSFPASLRAFGAEAAGLVSRPFGMAGNDATLRRAQMANQLMAMQEKDPAAFEAGLPGVQTALTTTVNPAFQKYASEGDSPEAKYIKALLAGKRPNLSPEEADLLRSLRHHRWLNRAR